MRSAPTDENELDDDGASELELEEDLDTADELWDVLTEPADDELRAEDEDDTTREIVPLDPRPALDADRTLGDPSDETECDEADDMGTVDEPGPMEGAHSGGNADADELVGVLPGYCISMFNLRIDTICSFN
jgi:hypothetical protein